MSFFNQYPYININDLNLDFILNAIKEMRNEVTNFVSINAIKYADPIQWNITSQYEKNTIVIDPQTGTAYISVAPVPSGVALTRDEYWTVVFDLGSFVTRAAKNFTTRYEQDTTTTATFNSVAGDWLVWGDTLYVANVNITAGDSYVPDGNIRRITVEEVKNTIMQLIADNYDAIIAMIGDLDDLTTTAKNNIVAAINELVSADNSLSDAINDEVQARQDADDAINNTIGDLNDLATTDKTSVVNAINEEVQARQNADGALSDKIGNLNDLQTTNKDSAVDAINEIVDGLSGLYDTADIRNYGGKADGATNCTNAFNACMAANNVVYLPNYNNTAYILDAVTLTDGQSVIGDEGTTINTSATNLLTVSGDNVNIENLIINTTGNVFYIDSSTKALSFIHIENVYSYGASRFIWDNSSANYTYTNLYVNRCAARHHVSYGVDLTKAFAFVIFNDVTIDSVGIIGQVPMFRVTNNAGCHFVRCEAEGGLSDGTHATHAGFVFQNSQAIWLERCMADTVDGAGFNFTNCQYVYMATCTASLCGSHGIAILSTTCLHFLITNCFIGGRSGMNVAPSGAHGIFNYNDYIKCVNIDIINMTGYAIADNASGTHNNYSDITIDNCNRSFVSSAGGGNVIGLISSVNDVPTFGNYRHRLCVANDILYDTPIGI